MENLLKKYKIHPLKRLGQNFLIDKGAVRRIIEAANLGLEDTVLEIGPGLGVLTQELAKKAKKVIAIEKDPRMCEILKETLKDFKNIEIIRGDIRKIENWKLESGNYKVVANLPFYLTAPVIRKFLEATLPPPAVDVKHRASACGGEGKDEDKVLIAPQQMVLVVQKEVGQRICARPPDMSLLAVSVQFYSKPEIISFVSKKSFWPSPRVDSAILKISALNQRRKSAFNQRLFRIVKAGFSQPRKMIINNLSKKLKIEKEKVKNWLLKNGIQPTQRAETLSVDDWILLTRSFKIE